MAFRPELPRRLFLAGLLACGVHPARAGRRRFHVALANLDETPGVTLDGLGFTGAELRRIFELAARTLPVDMLYFDNAGDGARAIANAEAAIAAKADLLIEYNADAEANAEIARRLAAASIPGLALIHPLPGAPLYGPDNRAAGRIAGRALGAFALETWPGEPGLGALIGGLADSAPAITGGQPVRADALLSKFLQTQRGQRVLIASRGIFRASTRRLRILGGRS